MTKIPSPRTGETEINLYDITSVEEAARMLLDIYPEPLYETSRRAHAAEARGLIHNMLFWQEVEMLIRQAQRQETYKIV